ncbi:helix-turn-helix transcriptional regulator [Desulfosporosinus sp. PR]|uniref:helix-turn-helix transcriptional regulator n=1 Tax=Candidatus Desulfosporosinus nitrosoreducens TaxID=3401928 RepID=UPI0027FC4DEE|nr:helix-turn-helix transcriptional regulator [Desulfosporosinus sp. PR]MDQ7094299.1 helix-turn-helix transcriptional regulator [Desulfosporosinus sp. PR]
MNDKTRLEALSAFLKARRAKIQPNSVGLLTGARRRTPGLRREEVAQLAGMSTTWYTWLEQGRDIQVSSSVLDSIAKALQLNSDERKYLYDLAFESNTKVFEPEVTQSKIPSPLERILAELKYCPTFITDRHFQIVGWNPLAALVFLDFEQIPTEQRNMIRLVFSRKELKSLAVNWRHFVKGFLAIFRAYYGQYVNDEWYNQFLQEMSELYPDFPSLWQESHVSMAPEVIIEFRHAKAGRMLFNMTSLQVQGAMDLRFNIYTPVEDSSTEVKLKQLIDKQK